MRPDYVHPDGWQWVVSESASDDAPRSYTLLTPARAMAAHVVRMDDGTWWAIAANLTEGSGLILHKGKDLPTLGAAVRAAENAYRPCAWTDPQVGIAVCEQRRLLDEVFCAEHLHIDLTGPVPEPVPAETDAGPDDAAPFRQLAAAGAAA